MLDGSHVVVMGTGLLGGQVFDMLARTPGLRLTLIGRNEDTVSNRANLARLTAMHLGFDPKVNIATTDVRDVDRTADLLRRLGPDLLFAALTARPYWMISQLRRTEPHQVTNSGMAPWLPHQLAPLVSLMSACRLADSRLPVLNAAFPDVTHAMLQAGGLSPYLGVGSVANSIPALRLAASYLLNVPSSQIEVRFIAEAYVTRCIPRLGHSGGAPFHLYVLANGSDVTAQLDIHRILNLVSTKFRRPGDSSSVALTAAAAVRVISAILSDEGAIVHAPGPLALIGGYPVQVWHDRIKVIYPAGLAPSQAHATNLSSASFNGIEKVSPDGDVSLTEPSAQLLTQLVGFPVKKFNYQEAAALSDEMIARLKRS